MRVNAEFKASDLEQASRFILTRSIGLGRDELRFEAKREICPARVLPLSK